MTRLILPLLLLVAALCMLLVVGASTLPSPAATLQIAYVQGFSAEPTLNIRLADVDRHLTLTLARHPRNGAILPRLVWSADGRYLAYCNASTLYMLDITRPKPQVITGDIDCTNAEPPIWAHSAPRLAFTYATDLDGNQTPHIYTLVYDASSATLTQHTINALTFGTSVAWAEDDHALHYYADVLFYMGADDTAAATAAMGFIQLDLNTNEETVYLYNQMCLIGATRWSADGERFACVLTTPTFDFESANLFMMTSDSDPPFEPQQLTSANGTDGNMVWSPDSERLAFVSYRGGEADIYLFDLATMQEKTITDDRNSDLSPVWSPNGRWLAYISGQSSVNIYVHDLNSGQTRAFMDDDSTNYAPVWSPNSDWIAFTSNPEGVPHLFTMRVDGSAYRRISAQHTEIGNFYAAWRP